MSRSLKKGPFVGSKFLLDFVSNNNIKSLCRNTTITLDLVDNQKIQIHNGKSFSKVVVSDSLIGKKLGEVANSRNFKGKKKGRK